MTVGAWTVAPLSVKREIDVENARSACATVPLTDT